MNRCYTESDVIAELRGWNEMSGDNDVVCVLWICVVVGTESYVCDQLPKLPEEPPPIGDCATVWNRARPTSVKDKMLAFLSASDNKSVIDWWNL